MRIAACVIIYHPDIELLHRNIAAFIDDVERVIIYRNSTEELNLNEEWKCKTVFLGDGENHYMAQALNECFIYCRRQGYDYLLTMDQDSVWEDFHSFTETVSRHLSSDVVIYAPNINHQLSEDHDVVTIESAITSGSLHNVQVVQQLGGFREDYKIYWVDGEFCHRARLAGYRILALPAYNMQQQFGHERRMAFGWLCADYTPTSYYYLFRNMLWMRREYSNHPSMKCICYTSIIYIRSILFGEDHKWNKLKAVARGFRDGMLRH